ncbi:IclR family transcriptional regulator [Nocardiopsis oceani]
MASQSSKHAAVEKKTPGSGSARKVLQILFSFSERRTAATVAELAELVDAPIPTTYRHVALLKEMQLIEEGTGGTYHPTAKVMSLARAAQLSNTLAEIAKPVLAEAADAFDETVMLMQHFGEGVVCVEVKETDRPMRFTFQRGHTAPLGVGASGKMVLASLQDLSRDHAVTGFDVDLTDVRRLGHATSEGEIDAGVWACSVPVVKGPGRPVALTVAGPSVRFDGKMRELAPSILQQHADRIKALLHRYSL